MTFAGSRSPGGDNAVAPRLLELLVCPTCRASLVAEADGALGCSICGGRFPVVNGIPRLQPPQLLAAQAATAEAFGWQWHAFADQHAAFREELLEWLSPVSPTDFQRKRVLDAGCGKGRHLLLGSNFGAEQIVGLDISSAVEVARRQTAHLPNVDVVQGDLLAPPLTAAFDLVYSIGVAHHVPRPAEAIRGLAACLKPGGTLHVWVYAHEGNLLVRRVVDPLRRFIARRAPREIMRLGTLPLAVLVKLIARLVRRSNPPAGFPYREYLARLARYSVRHIWAIVYDQLMAPTTHYIRRPELEEWFQAAGLVDVRIRSSRGMSWAATGRRRSA